MAISAIGKIPSWINRPVAANVSIPQGVLLVLTGGYASVGSDAAGNSFGGISISSQNNLGGAAGALNVPISDFYTRGFASQGNNRFAVTLATTPSVAMVGMDVTLSGSAGTSVALAPSAPAAPTLGTTAGGTLAAATSQVVIAYAGASTGWGPPSASATIAVAADNVTTVTAPSVIGPFGAYYIWAARGNAPLTLQNGGAAVASGTNFTEPTTGWTTTGAILTGGMTSNFVRVGKISEISSDGKSVIIELAPSGSTFQN